MALRRVALTAILSGFLYGLNLLHISFFSVGQIYCIRFRVVTYIFRKSR